MITIIIPVFGRSKLLLEAFNSVVTQEDETWNLLIADDGSDLETTEVISEWLLKNCSEKVTWVKRERNIGLFANLNMALQESQTEWNLLLCSDDVLYSRAVSRINELQKIWPSAGLILSTFDSINADGTSRNADSAWHHDQITHETDLIPPDAMLKSLLKLGSVNGNLTGLAFSKRIWKEVKPFRDDWRHAADWEWILRASEKEPIIINRVPIAKVRTHDGQLSNKNRETGHELEEVADVVRKLLQHPKLMNEEKRERWAADIMQHQLWNLIKQLPTTNLEKLKIELKIIQNTSGIQRTMGALIRSLKWRIKKKIKRLMGH